jgi:hypothetical protein
MDSSGSAWTVPRLAIPASSTNPILFPGPGNALVLSASHPTHPGRLILPAWVGPTSTHCGMGPGEPPNCHIWSYRSRIDAFLSDDSGRSFRETATRWPRNGNDESSAVEAAGGAVLMFSEPGYAHCPGWTATSAFPVSQHRCMLMGESDKRHIAVAICLYASS